MAGLGRKIPQDWEHVEKYPIRGAALPVPKKVETTITTPYMDELIVFYNQGNEGACFPAGTHILMSDGSIKHIEDVNLLDRVMTAECGVGQVTNLSVRKYKGDILNLVIWGHKHLALTPEHPVLTKRGYIKAKNLTEDDFIAFPKCLTEYVSKKIKPYNYLADINLNRIQTTGTRNWQIPGRRICTVRLNPAPKEIILDNDFGVIVGLFLAEGATTSNKVSFYFGGHERKTLVPRLDQLLREKLGVEPYVQIRGNGSIVVTIFGKIWKTLFEKLCATGSGSKFIHPDIISGPDEFLAGLVEGWLLGDGHCRYETSNGKRNVVSGVTISHDLAIGMFEIINYLGYQPIISTREPSNNRYAKVRQNIWEVGFQLDTNKHWRAESDEHYTWRKLRKIESTKFDDYVYNMSVEGDESYIAEGVGVHNCTGFSASWVMSLLNKLAIHLGYDAFWLYRQAQLVDGNRNTPPQEGSTIRAAFDTLKNKGHVIENIRTRLSNGPDVKEGVKIYRWAQTIDDIRAAINQRIPCVLGCNWYSEFDRPVMRKRGAITEYWIGTRSDWSSIRGGHAICINGASDSRQAVKLRNSWGKSYPPVYISYTSLQRLIGEAGEVGIPTDR